MKVRWQMAYYDIIITETLSRTESRAADSYDEALDIVKQEYSDQDIILGAEDFQDVEFE
jgi:hypothetical protein